MQAARLLTNIASASDERARGAILIVGDIYSGAPISAAFLARLVDRGCAVGLEPEDARESAVPHPPEKAARTGRPRRPRASIPRRRSPTDDR